MPDTTSHQLVVFSLGSEEYALPIGSVHEIIRYTEPRGKIIPIFDLAARMAIESSEPGKIVIVESGTGQVGVMVDDVEEVLTIAAEQLENVPSASSDAIEAIAKVGDRLVILLNPAGLFARASEDVAAA
jgi:purine-binding chemotaxis protein CheW